MVSLKWIVLMSLLKEFKAPQTATAYEFVLAVPKVTERGEKHGLTFYMWTPIKEYVRIVSRIKKSDNITPVLRDLHWVPVTISIPRFIGEARKLHHEVILDNIHPAVYHLRDPYISHADSGPKWTYRFHGTGVFELCVLLLSGLESAAIFQAVPVRYWGTKYFVFTFGKNPSVQIISANEAEIIVKVVFRFTPPSASILVNGEKHVAKSDVIIVIPSYEAFSISSCLEEKPPEKSLTGSHVESHSRIGVVSGNCDTDGQLKRCKQGAKPDVTHTDLAAEMLLPENTGGTEFHLFTIPARQYTPIRVTVCSTKGSTKLMFAGNSTSWTKTLTEIEEFDITEDVNLKSDKIILVYANMMSSCWNQTSKDVSDKLGDASFCQLVPTNLFSTEYTWIYPDVGANQHYAAIIFLKGQDTTIILNKDKIKNYKRKRSTWKISKHTPPHSVAHLMIEYHINRATSSNHKTFGCYIYGLAEYMGYMQAASFHDCRDRGEPGDGYDNDCDGRIDEEIENRKDDDHDGRVDEDQKSENPTTVKPRGRNPVHGHWGPWRSWVCSENHYLHKIRTCNNPVPSRHGKPCNGSDLQILKGSCPPKDVRVLLWFLLVPLAVLITWLNIIVKKSPPNPLMSELEKPIRNKKSVAILCDLTAMPESEKLVLLSKSQSV